MELGPEPAVICLSCDARFFRAHLTDERASRDQSAFTQALRQRLNDHRLTEAVQVGFDRVLRLEFEGPTRMTLVAELMGKHSNLLLLDEEGRIAAAAKWVGPSKSRRPITPGRPYVPPPFPPRKPLLACTPGERLDEAEGASPLLLDLLAATGWEPSSLLSRLRPVLIPHEGAYPMDLSPLGFLCEPSASYSQALAAHLATALSAAELEAVRHSALGQLRRVLLAREVALASLDEALDTAARAGRLQRQGELILAYGPSIPVGARVLECPDYDGTPLSIPLDPESDFKTNAERLFRKAKRAREGTPEALERKRRFETDANLLQTAIERLEQALSLDAARAVIEDAQRRGWFREHAPPAAPEDRPYEGHRIREVPTPEGFLVLYGETATANDYLTTRVAHPDDYWLHVRGAASAHVVVRTNRKPERVPHAVLLAAARLAVLHSPSKHAGLVSVDYTLKKFVRKPRGSSPGFVTYTREKTLDIQKA